MQNLSSKTKNRETLFEEMYISYLHKVQFFAYSYLHDFEKAKCLAQEVFISVLENEDGIDFERDPLPYLLTLTKNRCLNIIRKHKVEKRFQDFSKSNYDAESLNYLSLVDSSATKLYSKEIQDILSATMSKLPESIKLTFFLNRFKDMKYKEIAQMQGVSVKTIEYRIMVALKILRVKFKDYLPLVLGYLYLIL
jgi:RNA polymerase sigma-70 factor, ECF subfamily